MSRTVEAPAVGRERLARLLKLEGVSQAELARRLELNRSIITWWLSGKRTPTLEQAVAIEWLTETWAEGPIRVSEWVAMPRRRA